MNAKKNAWSLEDRQQARHQLITSRLLILQTKRLLLNSVTRRLDDTGLEALRERIERLRFETSLAQHAYRSAMLRWGSPEFRDYWLIAYSRLIEMGNTLSVKLRDAALSMPPEERFQLAVDVEMLESLVDNWTESMKASMAAAVA